MADLHQRKCASCGAPIQIGALKCEYCGMVYDTDYWAGTVKCVPLHMGKKRLVARTQVDDMLLKNNEATANNVKRELVERIAEGLAEYLKLPSCNDCGNLRKCDYEPPIGHYVRINCPHWEKSRGE